MVFAVLFICNLNSVRSPMAAAILRAEAGAGVKVESAGVHEGGIDPFVESALAEIGVSFAGHRPKSLHALDLSKFDLAIALTAEAAAEVRKCFPRERIEFWPIENPSEMRGDNEEILAAYREARDNLRVRIRDRFSIPHQIP